MTNWQIALLLKPFGMYLFMVVLVCPFTYLFKKYLPEGKIKRTLFKRIN